ncbi:MAG: energy transducer TonB [Chitinophagaceae bacterium]
METSKILSADWLDLLFDGRNKTYGAYDLRRTYTSRVVKAILLTGGIVALVFTGSVLASSLKPDIVKQTAKEGVVIRQIEVDKPKEPEPEQKRQPEPAPEKKAVPDVQPRVEKFTTFIVTEDPSSPPPAQSELTNAGIGLIKSDGPDDGGIQMPDPGPGDGKGLFDDTNQKTNDEFIPVEVDARFNGDWHKFLGRYLDANVPINNNAPQGRYTVMMQFVVDVDGSVSDIKALTNLGYGMEQEAIRVLKKAAKWIPAIQNGRPVKAYRRQPITFEVMNE